MKKNYFLFILLVSFALKSHAQYLPLTGGTLSGPLTINSGNQLQVPYVGFNSILSPPTTSGNVSLFANSASGSLDIVGSSAGWRFIPSSSSIYASPVLSIDPSGNTFIAGKIGIGITTPSATLNVQGGSTTTGLTNIASTLTARFNTANPPVVLGVGYVSSDNPFLQAFNSVNSTANSLIMNPFGGNVLIGKTSQNNTSYILDINGSERANSIVVNTTGADFVFEKDYQLKPLSYIRNYIHENHHLPGIASAEEMRSNGLDLGDNQNRLLQKVEELTLYLIEKDNENKALTKKLDEQEDRIAKLEDAIQKLTK